MVKKIRQIFLLFICVSLVVAVMLPAYAQGEAQNEKLQCISYRGDTAVYPANSKQAVLSAFTKGADYVSVNIRKNDSGDLVLCSENELQVEGVALKEMLSLIGEKILILDFEDNIREDVYELLRSENALSKAYMRIKDSADNINEWISSKQQAPEVIGVSSSFNIFTVCSFVRKLNSLPAIQLQSKNYFNVMYGSLCYKLYGDSVIAPMYDPDLCGQRSDSEDGWNDLIKKNFTIIETNNIDAFAAYKNNAAAMAERLGALLNKTQEINMQEYSLVSRENLSDAMETAELMLDGVSSCDELQSAYSALLLSVNNLTLKHGEDTQKGALNITAGKVIAAVLVGTAILAAQIYMYKMQKNNKSDKRRK